MRHISPPSEPNTAPGHKAFGIRKTRKSKSAIEPKETPARVVAHRTFCAAMGHGTAMRSRRPASEPNTYPADSHDTAGSRQKRRVRDLCVRFWD